ncbi:aldehyde dehydrogenase family protein, partial [Mycolicibacterium goodii]|uniref:aldehyde dehydrogenase family protein n=1 Tax=Mycolicibacterium goodii TaxID=134601 RepID=UPI001BDBE45F
DDQGPRSTGENATPEPQAAHHHNPTPATTNNLNRAAGERSRLKAKFTTARVGDPLSPDTQVGSLISKAQLERVLGYVETGRAE